MSPLSRNASNIELVSSGDELEDAAEALRAAEVDAVAPNDTVTDMPPVDLGTLTAEKLDAMSIDDVRAIANTLDIPERSKITEKAKLVEEILRRV